MRREPGDYGAGSAGGVVAKARATTPLGTAPRVVAAPKNCMLTSDPPAIAYIVKGDETTRAVNVQHGAPMTDTTLLSVLVTLLKDRSAASGDWEVDVTDTTAPDAYVFGPISKKVFETANPPIAVAWGALSAVTCPVKVSMVP